MKLFLTLFFLLGLATQVKAAHYPVAHNKQQLMLETPAWQTMSPKNIFGAEMTKNGHQELLNVVAYAYDIQSSSGFLGNCHVSGVELFTRRVGTELQYSAVVTLRDVNTGFGREFVLRANRLYGASLPGPFSFISHEATYYVGSSDEIGGRLLVGYLDTTYQVTRIEAPGFSCRR